MRQFVQDDVMNFLNEVSGRYPEAISFAAGRPSDILLQRLEPAAIFSAVSDFQLASGYSTSKLLQYGNTAGIVNDLIAQQIQCDDGIRVSANCLVVTSGCQEALYLCIAETCVSDKDVLLVRNPTYIGATGAARACGVMTHSIDESFGLSEGIERAAHELSERGMRAAALYVIPDFDNPTGSVLSRGEREDILTVCQTHKIVVLEDNPYGMFRFEGSHVPPMAALDQVGCVIYLSTYSKTISPTLRVGAATFPDSLFGDVMGRQRMIDAVVRRKSFLTVNTNQFGQAIVGGVLLREGGTLKNWVGPSLKAYSLNKDLMVACLSESFQRHGARVRWNSPKGGFFLSIELPFIFKETEVMTCADHYGVIAMPMSFFATDASQDRTVRLAFSSASIDDIKLGTERFCTYVRESSGLAV
jgi:(S)-3,5-dihydroxyphenylglycine transaminase